MPPEKVIEELENEIHLVEYVDGLYAENISLELLKSVRDLITRQQAEIERLKRENKILSINADNAFQDGLNEAQDLYAEQVKNEVQAEAINEFADKLKEKISQKVCCGRLSFVETEYEVNNLVKEMAGADNET